MAHNEFYEQVLVPKLDKYMGKMLTVKIVNATKFSMVGEVLDKPKMAGITAPLKRGEVSGVYAQSSKAKVPLPIIFLFFAVLLRVIWIFL